MEYRRPTRVRHESDMNQAQEGIEGRETLARTRHKLRLVIDIGVLTILIISVYSSRNWFIIVSYI